MCRTYTDLTRCLGSNHTEVLDPGIGDQGAIRGDVPVPREPRLVTLGSGNHEFLTPPSPPFSGLRLVVNSGDVLSVLGSVLDPGVSQSVRNSVRQKGEGLGTRRRESRLSGPLS